MSKTQQNLFGSTVRGGPRVGVMPPAAGALIVSGRYEVLHEVGRGGMGAVFKARHRQLEKDVALKISLPGGDLARFLREAKLLARISSPHVVAVHDYEVLEDGSPVLVMEWIDGQDLSHALKQRGTPLPESEVLAWMRQVCEGMLAAAEEGIIHRDLKPSNILIDHMRRARVADFGLARGPAASPDLSQTASALGTPHYMAPEQAETPRNVDTRADIYSFGATFYHILTGMVPFDGETMFSILFKHKAEPLVAPKARNPLLSDRVCAVIERCLAKSPGERFASFDALLKHLQPAEQANSPWQEDNDVELERYRAMYAQRRHTYLNNPEELTTPDVYSFHAGRTLRIMHGNIVHEKVDAIVSSQDEYLTMSRGVGKAIREAAGAEEMDREARRYAPVRPGRVVVTGAGRLDARFVFHPITLAHRDETVLWPSRDIITETLGGCLYHAEALYVKSMALPLIGTGVARFPKGVCLDTMFDFFARRLLRSLTSVTDVRILLYE